MSIQPQPFEAVPPETARIAQAAFPHGNVYLHLRDALGHTCPHCVRSHRATTHCGVTTEQA